MPSMCNPVEAGSSEDAQEGPEIPETQKLRGRSSGWWPLARSSCPLGGRLLHDLEPRLVPHSCVGQERPCLSPPCHHGKTLLNALMLVESLAGHCKHTISKGRLDMKSGESLCMTHHWGLGGSARCVPRSRVRARQGVCVCVADHSVHHMTHSLRARGLPLHPLRMMSARACRPDVRKLEEEKRAHPCVQGPEGQDLCRDSSRFALRGCTPKITQKQHLVRPACLGPFRRAMPCTTR